MTNIHDVPSSALIEKVANYFKSSGEKIKPPEWSAHVKTGSHVERVPQNPDWWYVRCAALYRKIYIEEPVGVSGLEKCMVGENGEVLNQPISGEPAVQSYGMLFSSLSLRAWSRRRRKEEEFLHQGEEAFLMQ